MLIGMFCCFRKNGVVFKLGDFIKVGLPNGRIPSAPCKWLGTVLSEKGEFRRWQQIPGAQLGEVEADAVASSGEGKCCIWASLPPEACLSAVLLQAQKNARGEIFHPVNIFTRFAPEIKPYFKTDRYPLVGRLASDLVFKRHERDFILKFGSGDN